LSRSFSGISEPATLADIKRELAVLIAAWPSAKEDLSAFMQVVVAEVVSEEPPRFILAAACRHLLRKSKFRPSLAEILALLSDDAFMQLRFTVSHIAAIETVPKYLQTRIDNGDYYTNERWLLEHQQRDEEQARREAKRARREAEARREQEDAARFAKVLEEADVSGYRHRIDALLDMPELQGSSLHIKHAQACASREHRPCDCVPDLSAHTANGDVFVVDPGGAVTKQVEQT
jgi:hypothetical protein